MKLNWNNYTSQKQLAEKVNPRPAERIVHLGLGAFFRAHQAWYTSAVDTQNEWGMVAFTGRTANAAQQIGGQDGLYTLITRGPVSDTFQIVDRIVRTADGNDLELLAAAVSNPQTAIVTLTITEAGYAFGLNSSAAAAESELAAILKGNPVTALGRLAWGLNQRRLQTGEPIALVSCDNIPANGKLLHSAMSRMISVFGAEATTWLEQKVSFVSTSVDRITPKTTAADVATVANQTVFEDEFPVVTEPFSDWVLQGEFPLGRPNWELAGAKFVTEIEPYENRKLWLLNGSHSLLAYLGQLRGHTTISQAIADATCLKAVNAFWDEAERVLANESLQVAKYRQALLERYSNPRIAHQLAQIAIDGSTKLRLRILPTALAECAAGRAGRGSSLAIAAWIGYVLQTPNFADSRAAQLNAGLAECLEQGQRIEYLLHALSPELAANQDFKNQIVQLVVELPNLMKN